VRGLSVVSQLLFVYVLLFVCFILIVIQCNYIGCSKTSISLKLLFFSRIKTFFFFFLQFVIIKHKGRRVMSDRDLKEALGSSSSISLDVFE